MDMSLSKCIVHVEVFVFFYETCSILHLSIMTIMNTMRTLQLHVCLIALWHIIYSYKIEGSNSLLPHA